MASGGAVTVPGRKLVDITKALPEGSVIEFKQEGSQMILACGRSRSNWPRSQRLIILGSRSAVT